MLGITATGIPERSPMRVLVLGASGFIGSNLARALRSRGHQVICVARHAPVEEVCIRHLSIDLSREQDPAPWRDRLRGGDGVVNAAGIFREGDGQQFEDMHVRGPAAVYRACAEVGVRVAVQLSALGADERATTAFHVTKHRSDEGMLAWLPQAVIVQPSLVFGWGGASARWFTMLASLPWIPVPAGDQRLQPVHVDDLVDAVVRILETPDLLSGHRLAVVGPVSLSLREYLSELRGALGLPEPRFVSVPRPLVRLGARLAGAMGSPWLNPSSMRMLEQGSTGDVKVLSRLLNRRPRAVKAFIKPEERAGWLALARLAWLKPVLRLSLALVWIGSGIVSVAVFPVADSGVLLARTGVPELMVPAVLWAAAGLDVLLGIATLVWPSRVLWAAQAMLILAYTAIISVCLLEFWAHPYGPVLKNLPLLGVLWLLHAFEERR